MHPPECCSVEMEFVVAQPKRYSSFQTKSGIPGSGWKKGGELNHRPIWSGVLGSSGEDPSY
jgi:hypothetical protein